MIEINNDFYQRQLRADCFFDTQQVLIHVEISHTDTMKILVDKITEDIKGLGGGVGFVCGLLGWM